MTNDTQTRVHYDECGYNGCENDATVKCTHPEYGPVYRCPKHTLSKTGEW